MSAQPSLEPRRRGEPSESFDSSPTESLAASATGPRIPENWPVDVTRHSWVMTVIVLLAIAVAGAFVFTLCRSERIAQATSQQDR